MLSDEQRIPHKNKKKAVHTNLNDEQLNPHNNNKKHNTTQKATRWASQYSQQQEKTQHHTES